MSIAAAVLSEIAGDVYSVDTRAVTPLDIAEIKGLPDTYPFGV